MKIEFSDIEKYIAINCEANGLDKNIVKGVIEKESRRDPYALRYEKKDVNIFEAQKFAKLNETSEITEIEGQKFSYGLMQILASTARGIGYSGPLGGLFNVQTNLFYGCKYLGNLKKRYPSGLDYISAYNEGYPAHNSEGHYANQDYVDDIVKLAQKY